MYCVMASSLLRPFLLVQASHFLRPLGSRMPGLAAIGSGVVLIKGGARGTEHLSRWSRQAGWQRWLALAGEWQVGAGARSPDWRPLPCTLLTGGVVADGRLLVEAVHIKHLVPADLLPR